MVAERRLDVLVEFDEKSRQYPIRSLLDTTQPRSYTWPLHTWLDQGREGACVGFAWAHEAAAVPMRRKVAEADARLIYKVAQTLDPWPGENYEGTSILAGAKAMQARGWLTQYRWGFSLQDALVAISRKGPVVFGLNWYEGMFEPDEAGLIHVQGQLMGRHGIVGIGVSTKTETVTLHNSWGRDWGDNGRCRITWKDLNRLLYEAGETCIPVVR